MQFYPFTGHVTYLAITQDSDGHFKFIAAEGVSDNIVNCIIKTEHMFTDQSE